MWLFFGKRSAFIKKVSEIVTQDIQSEQGYSPFSCPSGYQSPVTAIHSSNSQFSTPLQEESLPIPTFPESARDLMTMPKCRDQNEKSPPASENAERRKQQNRSSQIAFRERNRMNLKKLQEELIHSQSANEELYSVMEQLLERTEHLKRAIEDVLTSRLKRSQSTTFSSPWTPPNWRLK